MDRNTNIETSKLATSPRVMEYPAVVDTVQLSTARKLDIPGSLDAKTFDQVLEPFDEATRHEIICRVGEKFDEEIVYYLACMSLIQRNHKIRVIAEASEGLDGYLPWETALEARASELRQQRGLENTEITVERYESPIDASAILALSEIGITRPFETTSPLEFAD